MYLSPVSLHTPRPLVAYVLSGWIVFLALPVVLPCRENRLYTPLAARLRRASKGVSHSPRFFGGVFCPPSLAKIPIFHFFHENSVPFRRSILKGLLRQLLGLAYGKNDCPTMFDSLPSFSPPFNISVVYDILPFSLEPLTRFGSLRLSFRMQVPLNS